MNDAVILLSGGLDSTTLLGEILNNHNRIIGFTFKYNQSHEVEIDRAAEIAEFYGIVHHIIDIGTAFADSESTLIGQQSQPQKAYQDIIEPQPTYVPFRNAVFISIAVARALVYKCDTVYIAAHASDAQNWAYPDCSPEFAGSLSAAVYIGTYHQVRLLFPFIWLTKADIVSKAVKLSVPIHLTHSCYEGIPACGLCGTCRERVKAFKNAGVQDPIEYRIEIDWSVCDD